MRHASPRYALAPLVLCACVHGLAAQAAWRKLPGLEPGFQCAAFTDAVRGTVVLVGASYAAYFQPTGPIETWEWLGTGWRLIETAHRPPVPTWPFPLLNPASTDLAYDTARKRAVLFVAGQTWEWDGADWRNVAPLAAPPARFCTSLAYDPLRQRTVLFGGGSTTMLLADTWEWDGTSWTQRATSGPSPRSGAAMAFDSVRGKVLLFGGSTNDLWEWNGAQWAQVTTTVAPPPRQFACFAAQPSGPLVLFGGWGQSVADHWEWNGSAWTQRTPTTLPPAQSLTGMAYAPARQRLVLLGQAPNPAPLAKYYGTGTWEWDGASWVLSDEGWPGVSSAGVAFDSGRGRLVVPLGSSGTWEWDGTRWWRAPVAAPFVSGFAAAAYDSARHVTVVMDGQTSTYEWDGTRWRTAATTGPAWSAQLTYDVKRQRCVLFGPGYWSSYSGATWEWDGVAWTQRAVSGPSPRAGASLAYDAKRERVVLFGGETGTSSRANDTWEYDGSTWQLVTTVGPPPRVDAAMTYDVGRQRVVLHGGRVALGPGANAITDTWEYDGKTWVQTATHFARSGMVLAYDSWRQVVVRFGGFDGINGGNSDLSLYESVYPATFAGYGAGCGGATPPAIAAAPDALPWLGGTFTTTLTGVPAASPAALMVGASRTTWNGVPLPFALASLGMPGCTALASGDVLVPFQNARCEFTIPSNPALRGGGFYEQALALVPGYFPTGLVLSQGGAVIVGMR